MGSKRHVLVDVGDTALSDRRCKPSSIHQRRFVPPCQFTFGGDFAGVSPSSKANQAVAIFQTLKGRQPRRIQGVCGDVGPIESLRQVGALAGSKRIVVVGVRWIEEVHSTVGLTVLARHSVVEDGNFAEIRIGNGDVVVHPVTVMLVKELSVLRRSHVVSLWISPAPQELTRCEIVVIDNPKLIEGGHTQHEVLEVRIVVDGVDVEPVAGLHTWSAIVEVNLLHGFADHPKIGFGLVKILHEMVPRMPFPHDVSAAFPVGRQFQNHF